MLRAAQIGGSCKLVWFAILAKGRCFSDLRLKAFVHVATQICYKEINQYCKGLLLGAFSFRRSSKTYLSICFQHKLLQEASSSGYKPLPYDEGTQDEDISKEDKSKCRSYHQMDTFGSQWRWGIMIMMTERGKDCLVLNNLYYNHV